MSDQDAESFSLVASLLTYAIATRLAEKNGWSYVLGWYETLFRAFEAIGQQIHQNSGCNCQGEQDKYDA